MDIRQKLLPIFIAEADRDINALRRYLLKGEVPVADPDELEPAFRAAHTIKGTARLVEAHAIYRIALRLEALLGKHFAANTAPTPVECEAMQLAIGWLCQLLEALKKNQPEARTLVDEALHALDLAERFPGAARLTVLLDEEARQCASGPNDPFADDPELLPEAGHLLEKTDPFADDPDFGLELDVVSGTFGSRETGEIRAAADVVSLGLTEDPFADDPQLDLPGDPECAAVVMPDLFAEAPEPLPEWLSGPLPEPVFDPFSDDPDCLGGGDVVPIPRVEAPLSEEKSEAFNTFFPEQQTSENQVESRSQLHQPSIVAPTLVDDPFADDPDLDSGLDDGLNDVAGAGTQDPRALTDSSPPARRNEQIRRGHVACVFELSEHVYCLPIDQMLDIVELPDLIPLPLAPPPVVGLVNVCGRGMPVIDLSIVNPGASSSRTARRLVVGEFHDEHAAFLAEGAPFFSAEFSGEKIDLAEFLAKYRLHDLS